MPFAVAGAAISVAAPLISGAMAGSGTSDAAAAANAAQQQQLAYAKSIQTPFVNAGTSAVNQQQNLLGLNGADAASNAMSTFQASPSYQYQLSQGLSAVDNAAAAGGEFRSGNTQRAEETLGNNLAGQDFGNYYSRLQNLVTTGTGAANTLTNAAYQTGSGVASTDTSAAAEQANIDSNTGKAIGTGLNSLNSNLSYQDKTNTGLFAPNALFGASTPTAATSTLASGGFY